MDKTILFFFFYFSLRCFFLRFLIANCVLYFEILADSLAINPFLSQRMTDSSYMLTIGKSSLRSVYAIIKHQHTKRNSEACLLWDVNCSLSAIPQNIWYRLSLLFWSKQFSLPARNRSTQSLSNVGYKMSTNASGKGTFIGWWVVSPVAKTQLLLHHEPTPWGQSSWRGFSCVLHIISHTIDT